MIFTYFEQYNEIKGFFMGNLLQTCRVEYETNEYMEGLDFSSLELEKDKDILFCELESILSATEVQLTDQIDTLIDLLSEKMVEDIRQGNASKLSDRLTKIRKNIVDKISSSRVRIKLWSWVYKTW